MISKSHQWVDTILPENATIEGAIQALNETGLKIILVADEEHRLIGTVSDGDIRRGLLKGLNLKSVLESVLNRKAITVSPDETRENIVKLMSELGIQQIPIVDSSSKIVGLHLWHELSTVARRKNIMIIMAGGKGSRLYPQTQNCPKPMLQVRGKPILLWIIERARNQGFRKFYISIHYLGEVIEDYFGDGHNHGVEIEYLREDTPLGTAGALGLLEPIPESAIVVTNGDLLTDINYGDMVDFHEINQSKATMAVRLHEWQNQFGVVNTQGIDITGFIEKPIQQNYINAGVYVIDPAALSLIQQNTSVGMPEFFEKLRASKARVVAFPLHEAWIDIGNPNDLESAMTMQEDEAHKND